MSFQTKGNRSEFIESVAQRVEAALLRFPLAHRNGSTILFSAHSPPMEFVNCGDPYVHGYPKRYHLK